MKIKHPGLFCLALFTGLISVPATAEESAPKSDLQKAIEAGKPIFGARLRYEGVDADAFVETANALTYRLRVGVETGAYKNTSFLVDFDHIEDLADDFNSTINGKTAYPVVADPNATELNRIQITNKSLPDTTVTLGRQRIIMDDSRFVGNVGWRQNEQTFDAVRVQNESLGDLKVDVVYLNQINRIFGDDSPKGRWGGDSYLLNASHPTPVGKLTGFAYLVDVDEAGGAPSSQTIGARLAGAKELSGGKLGYVLSAAHQQDYGSSNIDYEANYYHAEGTFSAGKTLVGAGFEILDGDGSRGFQTPLATLHKFQGWADVFLATPADGVQDIYAKAGYTVGDVGPIKGVKLLGVYHDFSADTGGADYGSEIDLLASGKFGKIGITLKFADYSADEFAADTQKLWLQFDYAF